MFILNRLKEASAQHLGTYRNNAWLLTLKQNIGPFLKGELSSEQLDVQGTLALTLKDLVFNETAINDLLVGTGVVVHELKIRNISINLSEVKCRVEGIEVVLGAVPSTNKKQGSAPKSSNQKANKGSNEPTTIQSKQEDEESKTRGLETLSTLLNELADFINSRLDVTIVDLNISMKFNGSGNRGSDQKVKRSEAIVLSLHIPQFVFRDGIAEHYNTKEEIRSVSSEINKVFSLDSLKVKLNGIDIMESKDKISLNIRALLKSTDKKMKSVKMNMQFGNFNFTLLSSQLDLISQIMKSLEDIQEDLSKSQDMLLKHQHAQNMSVNSAALDESEEIDASMSNSMSSDDSNGLHKSSSFKEFKDLSVDSKLSHIVSQFKPGANQEETAKFASLYKKTITDMIKNGDGESDKPSPEEEEEDDVGDEEDDEFYDCDENDENNHDKPNTTANTILQHITIDFIGYFEFTFKNETSSNDFLFRLYDPKIILSNHTQENVKKQFMMQSFQNLSEGLSGSLHSSIFGMGSNMLPAASKHQDLRSSQISSNNREVVPSELCVNITIHEIEVIVFAPSSSSKRSTRSSGDGRATDSGGINERVEEVKKNAFTLLHVSGDVSNKKASAQAGHNVKHEDDDAAEEDQESGNLILPAEELSDDDSFDIPNPVEIFINPNIFSNPNSALSTNPNIEVTNKALGSANGEEVKMSVNLTFESIMVNFFPEHYVALIEDINTIQNALFNNNDNDGKVAAFIVDIHSKDIFLCVPLCDVTASLSSSVQVSSTRRDASFPLDRRNYNKRYGKDSHKKDPPYFIFQLNQIILNLENNNVSGRPVDDFYIDVTQCNAFIISQGMFSQAKKLVTTGRSETFQHSNLSDSTTLCMVSSPSAGGADLVTKVLETGGAKIASRAPSINSQSRKEGLYQKSQNTMRTWEPSENSNSGLGRSIMITSPDYDLSTEMVWIEFEGKIKLEVTSDDFVCLLDLQTQVAKFDLSSPQTDSPCPPPVLREDTLINSEEQDMKRPPLPPVVVVAFSTVEVSLLKPSSLSTSSDLESTHHHSMKCTVNDFILCSEPNSDINADVEQYGSVKTVMAIHRAQLAYYSPNNTWESIIDHTPNIRSKPVLNHHEMFSMTNSVTSCKINFVCLMLRYPREFDWLNEAMSLSSKVSKYYSSLVLSSTSALNKPSSGGGGEASVRVKFERKTLFITSEDMMLDMPGEFRGVNANSKSSQAVVDIVRASFNTVLMTPKPPIQTFSLSMDHVRLLFANNSLPLSASSEHSFIQVMSIPGERALSLRITDEENKQGFSSEVGDVSISMCSDSLSALQDHFTCINSPNLSQDDDSDTEEQLVLFEDSVDQESATNTDMYKSITTNLDSPISSLNSSEHNQRTLMDASFETRGFGMSSVTGSMADFGLEEPLDLLPCIEDYFYGDDAESKPDKNSDTKSDSSSAPTMKKKYDNDSISEDDEEDDEDEDDDSGKDDEWVIDAFNDLGSRDTELAQWVSKPKDTNQKRGKSKHVPIYELESAHWFENETRELKPHHVPIPQRQSRLESKVTNAKLDVELNLRTLTFRLFDGFDFVVNLDAVHSNEESHDTAGKKDKQNHNSSKPPAKIDLLSHANLDYFDVDSSANASANVEKDKKIAATAKKASSSHKFTSRKTDKVVEVSFSSLQLRYGEGMDNDAIHLNLVSDFIISQCLQGKAQNCLFEWKRFSQANEEMDEKGNLLRMLTLDIYTQSPEVGKSNMDSAKGNGSLGMSQSQLSLGRDVYLEVRVRPLRCCATWDLVDFLRTFVSPIIASMEASEANMINGDSCPLSPETPVIPANLSQSRASMGATTRGVPQIRSALIHPITLKIDFDTRLIDIEAVQQGDLLELLKLFPLRGVELDLRPVYIENASFLAFGEKIGTFYVEDLTSSQLMKFVAGAAPLRPLSTIGATAANLVLLPLEQYKLGRNGKIMYGLRRGALDFVKTVAVESVRASLKLSSAVTSSLRFIADSANPSTHSKKLPRGRGSGGGGGSTSLSSHHQQYNHHNNDRQHNILGRRQPQNVKSGLTQAQHSLRHGVSLAAHAIIAVPMEDFQRGNTKEAIQSAIRAVPIAVLSPMIGASEALSYTFLGIRNSMSPEIMHDEKTRYDV